MTGFEYTVIRSDRKSLSIEISSDARVIVRAPFRMSRARIREFVESKEDWILKNILKRQQIIESAGTPLTYEEISDLADKARDVISERVRYYAPIVGVNYNRITIRNQKTKWGSCSAKGNLNFNCLLMLTPPEVIDSVVVHELCHLIEMNHSAEFYKEVLRVYPEYYKWNRWLKANGSRIMSRNCT